MSFVLHSAHLKNVAGVSELTLDDIPERGITIIRGPNESGKSTILKAIELFFFTPKTKYSSGSRLIKALARKDLDAPPEMAFEFTLGPFRAKMKRIYSSKSVGACELTIVSPKRQQFSGNEAEDWLADHVSQYIDQNLTEALTAKQGVELQTLKKVGKISPLTSGLGSADDAAQDDASDTPLVRRAKEEYLKYFTNGGKPTGDFKAEQAKLKDLTAARDAAKQRVSAFERDVTDSDELHARKLGWSKQLPDLEAELATKEEAFQKARDAEDELSTLRERRQHAAAQLSSTSDTVAARAKLRTRITTLTEEVAQATAVHQAALDAAAKFDAALEAEKAKLVRARQQLIERRKYRDAAQLLVAWFAAKADAARVAERFETAEKTSEAAADARKLCAKLTITNNDVANLQAAESLANSRREVLERSAASMQISAHQSRQIGINGTQTDISESPRSVPVSDDIELTIDDVTVRICPDTNARDLQAAVAQAEADLAALKQSLGVESLAHAAAQAREHDEAEARLNAAQAALNAELKGQQLSELSDEAEAAVAAEQKLAGQLEDLDIAADNADEAREVAEFAQQQLEFAESEKDDADLAVQALQDASPKSDLVRAESQLGLKAEQLAADEAELEQSVAERSDEQLAKLVEENQAQIAQLDARIATAEAAGYDIELATAELGAARNRKKQVEKDLHTAELGLARLQSRVDDAEGCLQQLEKLESELDDATFAARRSQERAAAAKLLFETLDNHQRMAREKYEKPLLDRLESLAAPLFGPSVQFELNDNLEVVRRTVNDVTVEVDQLSGGAQEQLNILTRLAIAGLVADGDIAPVIIDDALGYTDEYRRIRMNMALNSAASGLQVLILTCEPERYAAITPAAEYSMSDLTLQVGK